MSRIRADSGTGRGLSKTEFTIVKIAALIPMHTANVRIAVAAYPRSFHNTFRPKLMSRIMTNPSRIERPYVRPVTDVPSFCLVLSAKGAAAVHPVRPCLDEREEDRINNRQRSEARRRIPLQADQP